MDNEVKYLYLDDIIPNRFQPRENFDEQALKELAVSIKEHGVIQPIVVRQIGEKYEIIAGERRYKASTMAGLTKIPAIIRNLDDKESSKVALIENLQRRDLTPIEEARTYQKILELDALTQEELARTMGKSQSAVANKLRLLSLTEEVQDALLHEQISERHARSLLNITDPQKQIDMLNKVISSRMTVRELDEEIKNMNNNNQSMINPIPTGNVSESSNVEASPIINQNLNPTEVDINKVRNEAVDISSPLISPIIGNNSPVDNNLNNNVSINPVNAGSISTDNEVIGGSGLLAGMNVNATNKVPSPEPISINNNSATNNQIPDNNIGLENNLYKNFDMPAVPIFEPDNSQTTQNNSSVVNNVESNNTVQEVKNAINTIKQKSNNIEVEEFDFEDFYQLVIRIDK